ncbi:MAG: hypothetical protein IKB58_03865 [Oscillospiraceae bacterium]|nr:hypothetical protein [Oscillospiraceae bacterium]
MSEEFEFYKDLREDAPEQVESAETRSRLQDPVRDKKKLLFAAVAVMVLLLVAFASARQGTGVDILRRYAATVGLEQNEDGTWGSYVYDGGRLSRFAALGEGHLLHVSGTAISILDGRGNLIYKKEAYMENPAVYSNGSAAIAYDVGGTTLWWLDKNGEVAKIDCNGILSATLNREGWLAVTDQYSGYKGAVQVYTPHQEKAFTFCSSERFVTDACVLDGGKRLAAVTVGQRDGVFTSNVLVYRLDSTEPETALAIDDGFVTHVGMVDGNIAFAADTCLTYMNSKGELNGSYDYSALYLRGCEFSEDFTTLLLTRYRSGTLGAVMTLNEKGEVIGAEEMDEEILDISAAGHYVSVLFNDRVEIYTRKMELYGTQELSRVTHIFQQEDGTVLAVGDTKAVLVMP